MARPRASWSIAPGVLVRQSASSAATAQMPLADYERVQPRSTLIGTFNMMRLVAAAIAALEPFADGERLASCLDLLRRGLRRPDRPGAYSSSKAARRRADAAGGARIAQWGVRSWRIAPGIFGTARAEGRAVRGAGIRRRFRFRVPFPKRLGAPARVRRAGAGIAPQRLSSTAK